MGTLYINEVVWCVNALKDSVVSVEDRVLEMVDCGVDEDIIIVPESRGNVELLLDGSDESEGLVDEIDSLLAN